MILLWLINSIKVEILNIHEACSYAEDYKNVYLERSQLNHLFRSVADQSPGVRKSSILLLCRL